MTPRPRKASPGKSSLRPRKPRPGKPGPGNSQKPSVANPSPRAPRGPRPLGVSVSLEPGAAIVPPRERRWLAGELAKVASLAGVAGGQVHVALVGDARMSLLHRRHTGVAGTTDVLAFDLRERPGDPIAADLVLCVDEARRQSALRGHDLRLELLLYALHGLLHLLGHDDHSVRGAAAMHRREDELLAAAGHPPVLRRGLRRKR